MKVLESSVAWQILRFFLEEGEQAHVQGIARRLRISPGSASTICRKLLGEGILEKEMKGNGSYYGLNNENPTVRAFRTALFVEKAVLSTPQDPRIETMSLYGNESLAHGEAKFLVLTNMRPEYCLRLLGRFEQRMGARCSFKIMTTTRFRELAAGRDPLFLEVFEGHADIKGNISG